MSGSCARGSDKDAPELFAGVTAIVVLGVVRHRWGRSGPRIVPDHLGAPMAGAGGGDESVAPGRIARADLRRDQIRVERAAARKQQDAGPPLVIGIEVDPEMAVGLAADRPAA